MSLEFQDEMLLAIARAVIRKPARLPKYLVQAARELDAGFKENPWDMVPFMNFESLLGHCSQKKYWATIAR